MRVSVVNITYTDAPEDPSAGAYGQDLGGRGQARKRRFWLPGVIS